MPCKGIGVHRTCLWHLPKVAPKVIESDQKWQKETESEHLHLLVVLNKYFWRNPVWMHDSIVSQCLAEAFVCTEHGCDTSQKLVQKWQEVIKSDKRWQKVKTKHLPPLKKNLPSFKKNITLFCRYIYWGEELVRHKGLKKKHYSLLQIFIGVRTWRKGKVAIHFKVTSGYYSFISTCHIHFNVTGGCKSKPTLFCSNLTACCALAWSNCKNMVNWQDETQALRLQ